MEKSEFDVVIVGGGHNALSCAAYLARAGVDVCILEGRVLGERVRVLRVHEHIRARLQLGVKARLGGGEQGAGLLRLTIGEPHAHGGVEEGRLRRPDRSAAIQRRRAHAPGRPERGDRRPSVAEPRDDLGRGPDVAAQAEHDRFDHLARSPGIRWSTDETLVAGSQAAPWAKMRAVFRSVA